MRQFMIVVVLLAAGVGAAKAEWKTIAPGMELGTFEASKKSEYGDSRITILRVDPNSWDLVFAGISQIPGSAQKTAKEWSEDQDFAAVINAGMFAQDHETHVGYVRYRDHVNGSDVDDYESVAAFDPKREGLPRFRIFDLDIPGVTIESILRDYSSVVQNLRLIKRPGQNRWSAKTEKWSEAALGEDKEGRILFIFCRSPFSMRDLNRELLSLGIGVVCAQHLEGGPEAQLYVAAGGVELEMTGSFETAFVENDENERAWPIPNVLGLRPRAPAGELNRGGKNE